MIDRLNGLLEDILLSADLHPRFLNTLSYLEYIGFRKIVKSQEERSISLEVLQHASEESRHAVMLKKLALKVGGNAFQTYQPDTLLCGTFAKSYFQTLDAGVARAYLRDHRSEDDVTRLTYAMVTYLVEVRAINIYNAYNQVASALKMPTPFSGLLAEEQRHLDGMESRLGSRKEFPELIEMERELFETFLESLATTLGSAAEGLHA